MLRETGADAIFAEGDVTPYARRRDEQVKAQLPLRLTRGLTMPSAPAQWSRTTARPYTVFTPFSKRWLSLPLPTPADLLPAPERIATPAGLASLPIPTQPALPAGVPFPAGEAEAQRRLARLHRRATMRPSPATATTATAPTWRAPRGCRPICASA